MVFKNNVYQSKFIVTYINVIAYYLKHTALKYYCKIKSNDIIFVIDNFVDLVFTVTPSLSIVIELTWIYGVK